MVRPATRRVNQATSYARDEQLVCNVELNDGVKFFFAFGKHAVKLLSLGYCPREAIQYKSATRSMSQAIVTKGRSKGMQQTAALGEKVGMCYEKIHIPIFARFVVL